MIKKIFLFLLIIIFFGTINYLVVDYLSTKKIDLVSIYVSSRDIEPRTIIEEKDIKEIKIPRGYVLENALINKNEIVGKITNIQGRIPKDSLFYNSNLDDIKKIPDSAVPLLEENQVAYVLSVNQSNNNFDTFIVGQKVDVYASIEMKNNSTLFDCLLESVRVISIKDRKGMEVSSKESTGGIQTLTIAIQQNQISIVSLADKVGTLELYATSKNNKNKESVLVKESKILNYIASNEPSMRE